MVERTPALESEKAEWLSWLRPQTRCEILGKLSNLLEIHISYLQNGNKIAYLAELFVRI